MINHNSQDIGKMNAFVPILEGFKIEMKIRAEMKIENLAPHARILALFRFLRLLCPVRFFKEKGLSNSDSSKDLS